LWLIDENSARFNHQAPLNMLRSLRLNVATKTALFVAVLFMLCATAMAVVGTISESKVANQRLAERGRELLATIVGFQPDLLTVRSVEGHRALLEKLAEARGVSSIIIVDQYGYRLADSDPKTPVQFERVDDPVISEVFRTKAAFEAPIDKHSVFAAPIFSASGEAIAVVRVDLPRLEVSNRTMDTLQRGLWLALFGLGLAMPLTGLALNRAMRPVRQLQEAAERASKRDFDAVVDIRTGDELEVLGNAFNEMIRQTNSSLKRIRRLAYVDELSGLPNKAAFMEHVGRAIADARAPGVVLLINLDRFKRLNDTFGEKEGDRLLTSAAERLRHVIASLRRRYNHEEARSPVLARMGGDAFAVMICGPSPVGAAKQCAKEILDALAQPIELANQVAIVSARIGIAQFPSDAADGEHLMRYANFAIDAAKADGGGTFRFFEPEMTRRAVERVTLENQMRGAFKNQEFECYYQPKVDARTGEISGCEALVRWRRDGRLIPPGLFIEVAEDSGLINEIGQFVLEESCRAAQRWRENGHTMNIAVNVSPVQFEREDFNRNVLQALKSSGLPPELLELELTESVAMDDPDALIAQIGPLRARGIRFAIDDFGTGYSSLSSLTRLPFDVFKIDQSFVRRMEGDQNARVVIETILAMARALGYQTVAEGVETESQFAFLRLNGCTYAQGYFFGKPQSEEEFVETLRRSQPRRPNPDPSSFLRKVVGD
jgi:diguanylate cyclase (GGDEF)-like protein